MTTEQEAIAALDAHDRRKSEYAGSRQDAQAWTATRARLLIELDRTRGKYAPSLEELRGAR